MKQKILTFIVNHNKFLALFSEPHAFHGPGGWFVVTGEVEKNESLHDAIIREVKEETNLDVLEIVQLNWSSKYNWHNEICYETNFLSIVKDGKIKLNEEHSKFSWMDLPEFIKIIKWEDDKDILKNVLEKALKKEKYFRGKKVVDYTKKNENTNTKSK